MSLFFATRLSLGLPKDASEIESRVIVDEEVRKYLQNPRLYEIGREQAVDISPELRSSADDDGEDEEEGYYIHNKVREGFGSLTEHE